MGGSVGKWVNQVGGQDKWVGRSGGWVGQVCSQVRWVRKVGQVGLSGRFGLEGSKSTTMSQSVTKVGIELLGQLKTMKSKANIKQHLLSRPLGLADYWWRLEGVITHWSHSIVQQKLHSDAHTALLHALYCCTYNTDSARKEIVAHTALLLVLSAAIWVSAAGGWVGSCSYSVLHN